MAWKKAGVVIEPPTHLEWSASHAMAPVVDTRDDTSVDVYFTTRDGDGRGHLARVRLDLAADPPSADDVEAEPLLAPGHLGAFDDHGVTASALVRRDDRLLLYYTGWNLGVTVPFYTAIGCAASDDDGRTFARVSPAPVLGRSRHDPYLALSPWVLPFDAGLRMWYVSGTRWVREDGRARHFYRITYADSDDGVAWRPSGVPCIDYRDDEHALARPCVVRDDDRYRMWYAYRGGAYRIGYAESGDGVKWERQDERAAIEPSRSGWDSEMIEYACVFDAGGTRRMLYNGNGYGASGIGYAEWSGEA